MKFKTLLSIRPAEIIAVALIFTGLYLTSLYSYPLFHVLAEIFSIVVACSIFILAWNSRRFLDNNYILYIGIAYLFIAGLDLVHTLAYKGMNIFYGYDSNLPTQLWIAARYMESISLLIAPLMLSRKIRDEHIIISYAAVTILLLVSIFSGIFPASYVEGSGLTPFKKTSEYIICGILLASTYLVLQKRSSFDPLVLKFLVASIVITIMSELSFTLYIDVFGFSNLMGHFLKIISFYFIYKAIVVTGLSKPYDLMFRNLKKSEENFMKSRDYVQTILDSIGDPTQVIDPGTYRIVMANRAVRDQSKELVEGSLLCYRSSHKRNTPCDDPVEPCPIKQVTETKAPVRIMHIHRDADNNERYVDIVATPILDEAGKVIQMIESIRDITDIKLAEMALQKERDRAQNYLDVVGVMIVIIDADQRISLLNRKSLEILGYEEQELMGKNWFDKIIPDGIRDAARADFGRLIAGETQFLEYYENPVLTKQGEERLIAWHNFVLRDSSGDITSLLSSGEDITLRKIAEEKLKKYAAELNRSNELKVLFTDVLSHDLLNPAGIIKGYTEILMDAEQDMEKINILQKINKHNEKLINIIKTASVFSKLESVEQLEFQKMDICNVIKDVVENFRPELDQKKITLGFEADGKHDAMLNSLIEEVFSNLLSNAIKYSPEGSRITINITDNRDFWKITVTDSGEGISDEDKKDLFERFKRANHSGIKGTGLGLAIVKRIIDLHGGRVGVEDNPQGPGSVFWITVKKIET